MKFRKNWKRFWTLDRHHAEGFTLVELIVVIAILAILAGVGTVGYSGYVKKANMQADITLASEIEQALMVAYYSGELEDGASVVVYYGNANDENTNVKVEGADAAMIAAFGESYPSLRLKWDGWKSEAGVVVDSTMIGHVDASGFNEDNLGDLLGSVQYLVDEVSGVLENGFVPIRDEAWAKYMEENGISTSDGRTAANATTMFVANTVGDYASDAEKKAEFWKMWCNFESAFNSTGAAFTMYACDFARAMALATYVDTQTSNTTNYTGMLQSSSGTQIISNINTVYSAIMSNNIDEFLAWLNISSMSETPPESSQAYNDCMAFLAYMSGLDSASDSLLADTDLSAENYYGDGNIQDYINSYISTGRLMADADGAMAFTVTNGKVLCNPLDY